VNASTINVATYGIILYTSLGIGSGLSHGIPEYDAEMVFINPKNSAANKMRSGFHCPNISTARAKVPYPATEALKFTEVGITKTRPPIPDKAPEINTPA
jgi:hypothetical protein